MEPSWDGSCSMNTIDLLSSDSVAGPCMSGVGQGEAHQNDPGQICEEMNQCDEFISAAVASGSPSLLSSSSEQQSPEDPSAIYQLDFDVEHLGKNRPQSKRVAVWKYVLPAHKGMQVAGHEAMLVWSTHSGKYTISVDGVDVFSSLAKGSVLEHKWKWSHIKACVVEDEDDDDGDCIAMRIIACRKPPVRSSKDFRCYEFLIGGKVFRDLPVYSRDGTTYGGEFQNEESGFDDGKLKSILDIIEPGWRATGFA